MSMGVVVEWCGGWWMDCGWYEVESEYCCGGGNVGVMEPIRRWWMKYTSRESGIVMGDKRRKGG